jgi:peptidoglycan hydrolase CwlO-like protein
MLSMNIIASHKAELEYHVVEHRGRTSELHSEKEHLTSQMSAAMAAHKELTAKYDEQLIKSKSIEAKANCN